MVRKDSVYCAILITIVLIAFPPSVIAAPQATTESRTATVRYSLFMKSNYSAPHDVEFVWSFRNTDWSKVSFQSSSPRLSGSADVDCQGQVVSKDSFDAIQAFGWGFQKASPSDLLHVDFKVRVDVSSFKPSSLMASSVGSVEDMGTYFSAADLAKYLNHSYYWDYSSSEVQSVIENIRTRVNGSTNVYTIVRGTLPWFAEHMMYAYPYEFDYPASRIKASEVLKQTFLGRYFGVCRHFADVFTAVMRGFGIPCVKESGLILEDIDGEVRVSGRHSWCIVFFPKIGWMRVEVTVPDRSSLDLAGVGLIPHPWYYVPEYMEYTNDEPRSSEGTVYPYVVLGGFIRVEEEEILFELTWEKIVLGCLLAATAALALAYTLMAAKVKKLERASRFAPGVQAPYPTPMFCTSCGAQRPALGRFCTRCGSRLE